MKGYKSFAFSVETEFGKDEATVWLYQQDLGPTAFAQEHSFAVIQYHQKKNEYLMTIQQRNLILSYEMVRDMADLIKKLNKHCTKKKLKSKT